MTAKPPGPAIVTEMALLFVRPSKSTRRAAPTVKLTVLRLRIVSSLPVTRPGMSPSSLTARTELADDGIVVGTEDELSAALEKAEAIQTGEEGLRASIVGGTSIFAAMNYEEHVARLRDGHDSALSLGI